MNILFVCTGNRIRSVMAEAIFSQLVPHNQYRSGGTGPADWDVPLDGYVQRALGEVGITIDAHRSRQVTAEDCEWADQIWTMGLYHAEWLKLHFKVDADERCTRLHIYDPIQTGAYKDYLYCAQELFSLASAIAANT